MPVDAVLAALKRHNRDPSVILEFWLPRQPTPEATFVAEEEWLRESIITARAAIAKHVETTP